MIDLLSIFLFASPDRISCRRPGTGAVIINVQPWRVVRWFSFVVGPDGSTWRGVGRRAGGRAGGCRAGGRAGVILHLPARPAVIFTLLLPVVSFDCIWIFSTFCRQSIFSAILFSYIWYTGMPDLSGASFGCTPGQPDAGGYRREVWAREI